LETKYELILYTVYLCSDFPLGHLFNDYLFNFDIITNVDRDKGFLCIAQIEDSIINLRQFEM
jgi:hypothetical protein